MRRYCSILLLLSFFLITAVLSLSGGCTPDPVITDDQEDEPLEEIEIEEPDFTDDDQVVEAPKPATNYFWPLLNHAQLVLSSTEIIDGPNLLESDTGFVGEFTRDSEYNGRMIWLVDKTEVFEVEWLLLSFDVEYYAQHELQFILNFGLEIEDLQPEPFQEGLQVYDVVQVEEQKGFRIVINRVVLGKDQESSLTDDPIDFVALDLSITVVDKPE